MTRSSALISVVALFIAGISIGALGMHLLDERGSGPPPPVERRGPGGGRGFMGERLAEELELSPEQREEMMAIHRERRGYGGPEMLGEDCAGDLEKLREKALLKEFEEYKEVKKKLKVFRLEAVRAGFKKAWQERDYTVIVAVAEKIPTKVLEEDPKLLMWYDQAVTRLEM